MIWDADALTISTTTSSLVAVNRPLGRTAYRMNDFDLIDRDGNGLFFGETIEIADSVWSAGNVSLACMPLRVFRRIARGTFESCAKRVTKSQIPDL